MLIYPLQGMWHHLRTREACQEVFDNIKKRVVRISCFCGDDPKGFDTSRKGDLGTFRAYMLNSFGTGKLKIRVWTPD